MPTREDKCWQGYGETGLYALLVETKKGTVTTKNSTANPKKLKQEPPYEK